MQLSQNAPSKKEMIPVRLISGEHANMVIRRVGAPISPRKLDTVAHLVVFAAPYKDANPSIADPTDADNLKDLIADLLIANFTASELIDRVLALPGWNIELSEDTAMRNLTHEDDLWYVCPTAYDKIVCRWPAMDTTISDGNADLSDPNLFDAVATYMKSAISVLSTVGYATLIYSAKNHAGDPVYAPAPFGSPWHAGPVGLAWLTEDEIDNLWPDENRLQKTYNAKCVINEELHQFNAYLAGNIYTYTLFTKDGSPIKKSKPYYGPYPVADMVDDAHAIVDYSR